MPNYPHPTRTARSKIFKLCLGLVWSWSGPRFESFCQSRRFIFLLVLVRFELVGSVDTFCLKLNWIIGTRRSRICARMYVNRLPFRWNFSNCQVSLFNDSSSLFNSEMIWELSDFPSRSSFNFSATFSNNSICWFLSILFCISCEKYTKDCTKMYQKCTKMVSQKYMKVCQKLYQGSTKMYVKRYLNTFLWINVLKMSTLCIRRWVVLGFHFSKFSIENRVLNFGSWFFAEGS